AHVPELEECGLRDQIACPVDVGLTGQFHYDAVITDTLNVLLSRAGRIDAVAQDVNVAIDVLAPHLVGHGAVGIIDLEGEVDSAAQVEPARDAADVERGGARDHDYSYDQ